MLEFTAPGPGSWVKETTHMSGVMPTYSVDQFQIGITRGFKEGGIRYGLPLDYLEMKPVNGFVYARQVMVGEPAEPKGPPPAWLFYLLTRLHPEMRRRNKSWLKAVRERLWEQDLHEWDTVMKPDSINRNLALARVDLQALSDADLIAHLEACNENMGEMFYRHHKYSVSSVMPVGRFVAVATASGDVGPQEAVALLKGSTPVSTGAFGEELGNVITALKAAGVAAPDLEQVPADAFCDHLRGVSDDVSAALEQYLEYAGTSLVSGYSIFEKTLNEMPHLIKARVLEGFRRAESSVSDDDVSEQIASTRNKLPESRREQFDRWLDAARHVNRLRDERGVYNDIWAAGISRMAILEAGRRLAEKGVIPDRELALECSHKELVDLMAGRDDSCVSDLEKRRDYRRSTSIEDAPDWLGMPPAEEPPPFHLMPRGLREATESIIAGMSHVNDDEEADEVDADAGATLTLQGIAVSPGVLEGTARVIVGPEDFDRIQQGDILITRNTSAAFNAVLPSLGGLVTDRGGLLSHAAIVSREYGIPGVVATKRATREIPDGARIRVDGDRGTVSLLS